MDAGFLWLIGDSLSAMILGWSAVADHERLLGDEDEETTVARYRFALVYGLQGFHDEAIQLNKLVVDWYTTSASPRASPTPSHCTNRPSG